MIGLSDNLSSGIELFYFQKKCGVFLFWLLSLELPKDSQLHKEELVSNLSETFRPTFPDAELSNLFLLVILAFFLNFNLFSIASILRDRN